MDKRPANRGGLVLVAKAERRDRADSVCSGYAGLASPQHRRETVARVPNAYGRVVARSDSDTARGGVMFFALFLAVVFSHITISGVSMLYHGAMGKHSVFLLNLRLASSITLIATACVYAVFR